MGYDLWNHSKFLTSKVRNMTRRGWLEKTYNNEKMLKGKVSVGKEITNDELDIIHPVGYVAHVKNSDKAEVLTMDVGADTSRRVILSVMGDREQHPKPDEGESWIYAPGDKKMYMRIKKKGDQQGGGQGGGGGGGGGGQTRAAGGGGAGAGGGGSQMQTIDHGRESGVHTEGEEERITSNTKGSYANKAEKGIGNETTQGNMTIKAASGNTQFEASKHVRKGETVRDGKMHVEGKVHATDHIAGGGATVSPTTRMSPFDDSSAGSGQQGQDSEPQRPQEDGTSQWQAQGRDGNTSLLQTAAKVGTMGGMMNVISQFMQNQNNQNNQGKPEEEQDEEMKRLLREMEELKQQLEEQNARPPLEWGS